MLDAATGNFTQSTSLTSVPGKACTLATINDMLYCQDSSATYGILANTITSIDWPDPSMPGYSAPTPGSLSVGGTSGNFQILGSSDLKPINSTYTPSGLIGGETVYVNYTIQNNGSAALFADFNVSFYLDDVFQSKQLVTDTLNSGYTVTLSFNATVTGDGIHDLKVVADSDNDIAESDETNNNLVRPVAVNWAAFQQGPDHRGFSAVDFAPVTNNTKWIFNTSGMIYSSPIIVNGVVYVGSDDFNVYAINITNGSKIWNYTTGGIVRSTPTYYNGTIYVGSNNNKVYAFYENGSLRWNVSTTGAIGFASPIVSDGAVYIGNQAGTFYALNATNGSKIWSIQNGCGGGNAFEEGAPSVADNIVYKINHCGSGLQSRKTSDGSLIINFNGNIDGSTSAALDGDVIYRGDVAGKVFAYNRFNGTLIWNYSIASIEKGSPAVAYGVVFIGEETNGASLAKVFALNATNGVQVWNFTTENTDIHSSPATAAGIVYISARNTSLPYQNTFYALNATTGSLIWKYGAPGLSASSPAISPGSSILVVGLNYSILAFGTFDLVPLQMNITPENLTEGQNATINVSVRNNGSIGVGWFNISLLVDNVEQSRQEAQLDFYMTQNYTFNWTAVAGSHNITIAVDPDDVIQNESSETNNNITQAINVASVACNLSVLIDGVNTTSFTNAGEPYNVTVNVTYANGTAFADALVMLIEDNGYSIFAMPQFQVTNVTNFVYGETRTNVNGMVSFTAIPTGGVDVDNSAVGDYNIRLDAFAADNVTSCDSKNFTVTNPNLPYATSDVPQVPNLGDIRSFKDKVAIAYLRIKDWIALGGGEIKTITIYDNGTSSGLNFTVIAGKPYGMNITVLNSSDDSPIPNVAVTFQEMNGFPPFILPQALESNVTNFAAGEAFTDANGNVQMTIIPTGGVDINEGAIGGYIILLDVYNGDDQILSTNLTCSGTDCNFPYASGSATEVPNMGNVKTFKDKVAIVYLRIKSWLANLG
jgi:outer membrane protein assembly factor BamB